MSGDNYYMPIENRRPAERTSARAVSCIESILSLAHPCFQEVSGNKDSHNTWIKTGLCFQEMQEQRKWDFLPEVGMI